MSFPIACRLKSKFHKGAKRKSSRFGTKLFSHPCIYLVLQLPTSTFLESSLLCTCVYVPAQFPLSPRECLPFKNQLLCHLLYQHNQLLSSVFQSFSTHSAIVLICAVAFICVFPLLPPKCPSSRNPIFFVFQCPGYL